MNISVTRILTVGIGIFLSLFTASCTFQKNVSPPPQIHLDAHSLHSFDGDQFPYTHWLSEQEPQIVIIGIHGINGASSDFRPLAQHLLAESPKIAIYSAETRGQGNDPIVARRGHIEDKEDWFRDLSAFTHLIRKKHPEAKIVWCGESMGALIALHTFAHAQEAQPQSYADALILASPITAIRRDFPRWKVSLAKLAGFLFPKVRVPLENFSDEEDVRVTKNTVHHEQAATNSYHVKKHSLHLLTTLGKMIESSAEASQKLKVPLLILHGGKDIFSDPRDIKEFLSQLPESAPGTRKFYPESYHLLFHDHQSDLVITDIASWLKALLK